MPNPLDIQGGEETLSDIVPDTAPPNGETDEQKTARERKNTVDRLDVTAPNTARRSGSGINRLVKTLNDGAWLQRQRMNSVYEIKKQNDNAKTMMPSEPLHHATLSLNSWK